jgi:hypothetical protein
LHALFFSYSDSTHRNDLNRKFKVQIVNNLLTPRMFIIAVPALVLLAILHYALPQVDVVRAVGVEIKRIDVEDVDAGQKLTRDVYFVQTETLDGKPYVYRNEDNFFYGKFNAADLQARVQSLAAGKQTVAIRHYGWRLTLFSTFPNAVSVWSVDEGYRHIPVFNILVFATLAGLSAFGFRRARRAAAARVEARQLREAEQMEREKAKTQDAEKSADRAREEALRKQSDIDDFLNTNNDKPD